MDTCDTTLGHESTSIGTKRQRKGQGPGGVLRKFEAGREIPQLDLGRDRSTRGREHTTVRTHDESFTVPDVDRAYLPSGRRVVHADGPTVSDHYLPLRAEGQCVGPVDRKPNETPNHLSTAHIPKARGFILAAGHDHPAVPAQDDRLDHVGVPLLQHDLHAVWRSRTVLDPCLSGPYVDVLFGEQGTCRIEHPDEDHDDDWHCWPLHRNRCPLRTSVARINRISGISRLRAAQYTEEKAPLTASHGLPCSKPPQIFIHGTSRQADLSARPRESCQSSGCSSQLQATSTVGTQPPP